MREIQNTIYEESDTPEIYQKMGVQVIRGRARFVSANAVKIVDSQNANQQISSRFFVLATGSSPSIPFIDGLSGVPYLTNETIFSISKLPAKMLVIGAGPVGIEMAQAFRRFGSEVAVLDLADKILPRDDGELSRPLQQNLAAEGIDFILGNPVRQIRWDGTNIRVIVDGPSRATLECDTLLVATGRRANLSSLNLESAGVRTGEDGILVDRHCRTSAKNIFACGDVTGLYQLTHMSEHMAKVAVSVALLRLPTSYEKKNVPRCTYTDPELAHVGASEDDLKKRGTAYGIYRFPFTRIDRAMTDSETAGLIKVLARKLDGKIYGASILGTNAGEMISEFALAMRNGITLRRIADTVHPYPTYAMGNRRAADQWYARKQSRMFVRLLKLVFGYRGQLPDTSDPNRIV